MSAQAGREPEEPLAESAPLAWRLAPELCRREPGGDAVSCAWNHGLWQYLRILGLVTSPSYQADFYASALGRIANPSPRVLISGAADYSMLAVVLGAFRAKGSRPSITVIDVCDTPLALCRWYAEKVGATIETLRADIRDYAPAGGFDAVCSDNFFGRFPAQERAAVAARWKALLLPSGIAITVSRVRPEGTDAPVRFTDAQAEAFRASVYQAARAAPGLADQAEALAAAASTYARRHFTYPLRTAEELRRDFESAGFTIERQETASVSGGNVQARSGPSVRGSQTYVRLVARRP